MLHRSPSKPLNQSSNVNAITEHNPIGFVTQGKHRQLEDSNQVLSATAQVLTKSKGRFHKGRALIDSGFQATLINEACSARLKLLK